MTTTCWWPCLLLGVLGANACTKPHDTLPGLLDQARRVNGDVTVLSRVAPFPGVERMRESISGRVNAESTSVFSVWPVAATLGDTRRSALLKLISISPRVAKDLGLNAVPRAYSPGSEVEVALAEGLARSLRANRGDRVKLIVPEGPGTLGPANVECVVIGLFAVGHPKWDESLVVADITTSTQLLLLPTGVEIRLAVPDERADVASSLRQQLNGQFEVMSVEDLTRSIFDGADKAQ